MARCSDVLRISLVAAVLTAVGSSPAWAGICPWCGGNSATVGDGIVFDELNVNSRIHHVDGPRILGAVLKQVPVRLQVIGDNLEAIPPTGPIKRGSDLVGLIVHLGMDDGRAYDLLFLDPPRDAVTYWVSPKESVPVYTIYVKKVHNRNRPPPHAPGPKPDCPADDRPVSDAKDALCTGKPSPDDNGQFYALAYTGDRFQEDHTVVPQPPGWFNLACKGTAAAKMHLLRHTEAGSTSTLTTTLDQRTTMLRAITADYCADGTPWTANGTPLFWTDARDWFHLEDQGYVTSGAPHFAQDVEAVWGPAGELLCLNEPRRTPKHPTTSRCDAPAVMRREVITGPLACPRSRPLPRCDAFSWTTPTFSGGVQQVPLPSPLTPLGYVITVNDTRPTNKHDYCGPLP
jgi:hypothetical protein